MSQYTELPWDLIPGVGIFYGNRVPSDGVGLAYVHTTLPLPGDVIDISDDLKDSSKYSGNTIPGIIKVLEVGSGILIDPSTGLDYVAPTDNVLLTTVTSQITSSNGTLINIPLFYRQRLRYPLLISSLPSSLASQFIGGIPPGSDTYPSAALVDLASYVTITTAGGGPVPAGYVWNVLPLAISGDDLAINLYTNFCGSYNDNYVVSWGGYSETLNVQPAYYQSLTTTTSTAYLATPVYSTSVSEQLVSVTGSGSSTATLTASTSPPPYIVESNAIALTNTVSVLANPNYSNSTTNIAVTTSYPYFTYDPSNLFVSYPSQPTRYTTAQSIAPTTSTTALSLSLTLSVQSDANGTGAVAVILQDSNGNTLESFGLIESSTTLEYYNTNAIAGIYTWVVTPTADYTKATQNINGIPANTYSYSVTFSGSYSWPTVLSYSYAANNGGSQTYTTPTTTTAPTSSYPLSFSITNITTPIDGNGATSYTVTLLPPGSNTYLQRWTNITTPQTLSYSNAAAVAGQYSWVVQPTVIPTSVGTSSYNLVLDASLKYYLPNTNQVSAYTITEGNYWTITTDATTLPPTNTNTQLSLFINAVTTPSNQYGSSSLTVALVDPYGIYLSQWQGVQANQTLTYSAPGCTQGTYTWRLQAYCTDNNIGASSFTVSATAIASWYDTSGSTSSLNNQTIGFNIGLYVPNGTIYLTTDDGPQIFVQEPHNINNQENWYLKIHRGWLNYTDSNNNTYLVGLQPYYQQNFNQVIPIISLLGEKATILSSNKIQVSHRPLLWNPIAYPVDITVQRGGIRTVITRDNGMTNGNYVQESILDCNANRGEFTVSSYIFLDTDIVTVSYTYLEYYYTYRGVVDIFGRFVHLDVNPTGGHTWMNLWNIVDNETQVPITGSDQQAITSYTAPVVHQREKFMNIVPNGTATISAVAIQTPTVAQATATTNFTQSVSQIITKTPTNVVETFNLNGNGVAVIQAIPQTSTVVNAATQTLAYNTQANLVATTSQVDVVNLNSSTASNILICNSADSVTVQNERVTSEYANFSCNSKVTSFQIPQIAGIYEHNWAVGPTVQVAAQGTSLVPNQNGAVYELNFASLTNSTNNGGLGTTESYPYNLYDFENAHWTQLSGNPQYNGPDCPPPQFFTTIQVTDPAGKVQYRQQLPLMSSGTVVLSMPNATLTGIYTVQAYHTVNVSGVTQADYEVWEWIDDLPLGNPTYVTSGSLAISSIQSTSTYSYYSQNSNTEQYQTPNNTVAPVNTSTQVTFSLANVICSSDANGQGAYNISLSDPTGTVVQQWTNITYATSLAYYNVNAIAGVYTWSIYASVILPQNPTGVNAYSCTSQITYYWSEVDASSVTTYSAGYAPKVCTFSTDPQTAAPTGPNSALSIIFNGSGSNNTVLKSTVNGYAQLNVNLTDPYGNAAGNWTVTANNVANGITYYNTATDFFGNPLAPAGSYTWSIQLVVIPNSGATKPQQYGCQANIVFDWYDSNQITTYTYSNIGGTSTYNTVLQTLQPIDIASQLSATFTYTNMPSDSYGSSSMSVQLFDPFGNLLNTWTNLSSALTYHNTNAVSGIYAWVVNYNCTNNGTGSSTYDVSWSGTFQNKVKTIVTSYTLGTGTPVSYLTGSGTLAPTGSSVQLGFRMPILYDSSDNNGYGYLNLTLSDPNGNLLQTWSGITNQNTYTYSNAAAIAGQYKWTVTPYAYANNTGQSTYTISFKGSYVWYKMVLVNGTMYVEANAPTQSYQINVTTPPTSSYPLSLNIGGLQLANDGVNSGFFGVQLFDPSSNVLATWNPVNSPQILTWSNNSAVTGTYTWTVDAGVFNSNTVAGNYLSTMNAQISYYQNYNVQTVFYVAPTFNLQSYQTGPFTTTPTTPWSQVSFELDSFNYPAEFLGPYGQPRYSMNLLISLIDPLGVTQQQTTVNAPTSSSGPIVLTWYSPTAAPGNYTWTVQPQITINNNGTAVIPISFSGQIGFYAPVDDEVPTVILTQKIIYLYLTASGWPFHAVLDPGDDPTQPLYYDTNNALLGTIYTAMPTIHALT